MVNSRWFHLAPDHVIIGLLLVEGLLWLSDRLGWPAWHKGYSVLAAVATVPLALFFLALWFALALILHRRFQFYLRTLLVLVIVVILPCSWLSVTMREAERQRTAVTAFAKLNRLAVWSDDAPTQPDWLRKLLGANFFDSIALLRLERTAVTDAELGCVTGFSRLQRLCLDFTQVTDAGLKHLKGLSQLQQLWLTNAQVTDGGLEQIRGLRQLHVLCLDGTRVTDAGMEHLKGLSQLETLALGGTKVTDAGLEQLEGLHQLGDLDLGNTKVTDAGLGHLKGLSELRWLTLTDTHATDEGVKQLQQALPNCQITR